jgi:hypothetical protein
VRHFIVLAACAPGALAPAQMVVHQGVDRYCAGVDRDWRESIKTLFVTPQDNRATIECAADISDN